tara:strand:+ start:1360 stop:1647 length:288 start_codon:yes stop_codon:yes gene_type:complete
MVYPIKFPGKLSGVAFFFFALVAQTSQADIGDGPRAYLPPPIDTDVFSLYGMKVSGNSMIGSGRQIYTPDPYLCQALMPRMTKRNKKHPIGQNLF